MTERDENIIAGIIVGSRLPFMDKERLIGVMRHDAEAARISVKSDDWSELCVCGHGRNDHGNDGEGHCGASAACRRGGCKQFRSALTAVSRPSSGEGK